MEYWKVRWFHEFPDEAIVFYSEIGDDGYEVRKVQLYRDGRRLKADCVYESGEIGLSEAPVGRIEDVAAQSEFAAEIIELGEFKSAWDRAAWARG
ncbi:DUF6881 domain-containing protein [Streptomyces purpurogeneiscleroticus]|uniref:DUF6881 domain-containing protein n=1 Tax=Streptomyces purpurogeneiscleroticus TaxID=68259 RepID=UPI001CC1AE3E|nr:hypothetical protein [Streptomyces purpurogeneiscleroticus]MBZ4014187.1 hypothetical protein [Streptomyces purpurogeneiscleroticus]